MANSKSLWAEMRVTWAGIGRSLQDKGGPTKANNRLTSARDPQLPKRGQDILSPQRARQPHGRTASSASRSASITPGPCVGFLELRGITVQPIYRAASGGCSHFRCERRSQTFNGTRGSKPHYSTRRMEPWTEAHPCRRDRSLKSSPGTV